MNEPLTPELGAPSGNRYVSWGAGAPGPLRMLKAHVREVRPTTRLWMDMLLPLALVAVLTAGVVPWRSTTLFIVAMVLLHYAATVLNDVQDAETDRHSSEILRRTRPIAVGTISRKLAIVEILVCSVLGITAAALVNWQLGFACTVLILLVSQHELPPLRTQSRPIFSPIAGLIGLAGIIFCVCIAAARAPDLAGWLYLAFVVIYLGGGEMLVKDVRDVDNDAQGGKQTASVRYGAARSTRVALAVYLVATVCYITFAAVTLHRGHTALGIGLLAGTIVLLTWAALVSWAVGRLDTTATRAGAGRLLHRGSVTTFAAMSVLVIVLELGARA